FDGARRFKLPGFAVLRDADRPEETPPMKTLLLLLHVFGLGAGFVGGFGIFLVQTGINKSPAAEAPILARAQPPLAMFGDAGLILLWATGLIMVLSRPGGLGSLPAAFWWKIACV